MICLITSDAADDVSGDESSSFVEPSVPRRNDEAERQELPRVVHHSQKFILGLLNRSAAKQPGCAAVDRIVSSFVTNDRTGINPIRDVFIANFPVPGVGREKC